MHTLKRASAPSCIHHFMLHPVLTNPDSRYSQEMDEYDNPLQEHHYDDGYEPIMDLESIESLHQEVELEPDAFSDVNSEYMKLPLPEGIDDHEDSLEYEPSISGDHSQTLPEDTFKPEDADSLRRVIGDACASTPTVLSVTMPWELPGINLILGEEASVVPTPILGPVLVSPRELYQQNLPPVCPVLNTLEAPIKR